MKEENKGWANVRPAPIGNKYNEKWSPEIILEQVTKVYDTLTFDVKGTGDNIVRRNDIKLMKEALLIHLIPSDLWLHWKRKMKKDEYKDNEIAHQVLRVMKLCDDITECRLIDSGSKMDEFVLKNKYRFADRVLNDITSKGKRIKNDPLFGGNTVLEFKIVEQKPDDEEN